MIGDQPTDNRNDGTVSKKKSILTMVTSTLMMLILHLKDLFINANIVNMKKSNKAEKMNQEENEKAIIIRKCCCEYSRFFMLLL